MKRVAYRRGKKHQQANMSKKRIADGNVAMELATFCAGVGYRDARKRRGMSISQLYLWRKRFLEEGGTALKSSAKRTNLQGRQLRAEDDRFERMLDEERLVTRLIERASEPQAGSKNHRKTDEGKGTIRKMGMPEAKD